MSEKISPLLPDGAPGLPEDGERFLPQFRGIIRYEHVHRYALCTPFVQRRDVLDIACGDGYGSALLASVAASVIGVDLSASAVEHARAAYQLPNIRFEVGDATALALPTASVDVVVSFETIEHLAAHEAMLDECKRVLRQDGLIIISSPNKATYTDEAGHHNKFHIRELYVDEFERLLRSRFENVVLFGQRVTAVSLVSRLDRPPGYTVGYQGTPMRVGRGIAVPEPLYVIALCSDGDVGADAAQSIFLDEEQELFTEMRATLERSIQLFTRARHRAELHALALRDGGDLPDKEALLARIEATGVLDTVEDDCTGSACPGTVIVRQSNRLVIEGWALAQGGAPDHVIVAINGSPITRAVPVSRPDVAAIHGEDAYLAGFRALISVDRPEGPYRLQILAHGIDQEGYGLVAERQIVVVEPARAQLCASLRVDLPISGGTEIEEGCSVAANELLSLRASGVDPSDGSPLAAAAFLIDDEMVVPCGYGDARPDSAGMGGIATIGVGARSEVVAGFLGHGSHVVRALGLTATGSLLESENAVRFMIVPTRGDEDSEITQGEGHSIGPRNAVWRSGAVCERNRSGGTDQSSSERAADG